MLFILHSLFGTLFASTKWSLVFLRSTQKPTAVKTNTKNKSDYINKTKTTQTAKMTKSANENNSQYVKPRHIKRTIVTDSNQQAHLTADLNGCVNLCFKKRFKRKSAFILVKP